MKIQVREASLISLCVLTLRRMSKREQGKTSERVSMNDCETLANERSYTSLSEEIRRHAHLIEPKEPQFETEYEASYVHQDAESPPHSEFLLKSLSPRRHAKRVEELWTNLNQSTAELLNHLETLMSILCLTMEEIKLILLTACEEIKMKKIHSPYLKRLYDALLVYESKCIDEGEEMKHQSELYTNIEEVLVNNEILNFLTQYQKLCAEK